MHRRPNGMHPPMQQFVSFGQQLAPQQCSPLEHTPRPPQHTALAETQVVPQQISPLWQQPPAQGVSQTHWHV